MAQSTQRSGVQLFGVTSHTVLRSSVERQDPTTAILVLLDFADHVLSPLLVRSGTDGLELERHLEHRFGSLDPVTKFQPRRPAWRARESAEPRRPALAEVAGVR